MTTLRPYPDLKCRCWNIPRGHQRDCPLRLQRLAGRLLLAQGADVLTFLAFYLVVGPSIHQERNPLILLLMAMGGLAAVAVFKMAVTLLVVRRSGRRLVITNRWYLPLRTILTSAATASGIVGAGFNAAAVIATVIL